VDDLGTKDISFSNMSMERLEMLYTQMPLLFPWTSKHIEDHHLIDEN
jgi:hypothetical protein